jgi:hypothetical protein
MDNNAPLALPSPPPPPQPEVAVMLAALEVTIAMIAMKVTMLGQVLLLQQHLHSLFLKM